ncbi:ParB/RepB/Spo0J family partition protein [bacterium AH-315-M10]|nr:ParB/RepB/Spo0J family partition protein [bacterium AH-315-M10]
MSKRIAATREVPLDAIQPDGTFKYRCRTDQEALIRRLAEDIQANGLLVPLLVRDQGDGKYQLVAGCRRHSALLQLRDGGAKSFEHVLAHVYPQSTSTKTLLAARFAENIERKNLSPLDLSFAAEKLAAKDGLTHQEIADLLRLGNKKKVQRLLRLQSAPVGVRAAVHAGWLSYTAALALMEAGDKQATVALFKQVRKDQPSNPWPVRRIRAAIRSQKSERESQAASVGELKSLGFGVRRSPTGGYSITLRIEDLEMLHEQLVEYTRQVAQLNGTNGDGAGS